MCTAVFTASARYLALVLPVVVLLSCHDRKAAVPAGTPINSSDCCGGGADAYEVPEVQEAPSFPGGETAMYAWIGNNLHHTAGDGPGTSWVQFNVACDGSLHDPFIKLGSDPDLDSAAVRLVRAMPAWTPGKVKGRPVCVRYVLPVKSGGK